jgi:hypothetical protein
MMSWKDALKTSRVFPRLGNGANVKGNIPAFGSVPSGMLRSKSPLLTLFCCTPPTQSWFATSAGAPGGTSAIADTRLSTPCPEFCVSQVVVSGGIAKTSSTDAFPRSTTLTCASSTGASVRKCVTYARPPSEIAIARALGHPSFMSASTARSRPRTRTSLVPWHVTTRWSPPGVGAIP